MQIALAKSGTKDGAKSGVAPMVLSMDSMLLPPKAKARYSDDIDVASRSTLASAAGVTKLAVSDASAAQRVASAVNSTAAGRTLKASSAVRFERRR